MHNRQNQVPRKIRKGARVKLVGESPFVGLDPDPLPFGSEGTVSSIERATGIVQVAWDNQHWLKAHYTDLEVLPK